MKKSNTIFRIIRTLLLIIYVSLLLIHYVIRDRFQVVSTIYYGTPSIIIIMFGVIIALFYLRRKPTFYFVVISIIVSLTNFAFHNFGSSHSEITNANVSSILLWNVADNEPLPTDILIQHIQQTAPVIIALVEATKVSQNDLNLLKTACPDYNFSILEGDMLIGTTGNVQHINYKFDGDYYKLNYFTVVFKDNQLSVMIADVSAGPTLDRSIPLHKILKIAHANKLDLIVGDFNTPYESVFFDNFKTDYNSFHNRSIGLTSTWPVPIPMIEIDQIWINKAFQPIRMEKFCYELSDHKLLIAEYR